MFDTIDGDRARWRRGMIAIVLCLSFLSGITASTASAFDAAPAEAEKQPAADGDHMAPGVAHEQPGPMTATRRDVDLAIWSLITFIVFVFVLRKLAWGPMIEGLDKRESSVLQNIADAESARFNAEKMLAAHTEKLDKAQDEIRELIAEARRDADHTKADIVALAQKEAEATKQRAVQEIGRARDQALDDLFAFMSKSVEQATQQVVGRSLTGADHERLIAEALNNVTNRNN
ncbi:MAG: ATP synthase F0 subunit B [Planctomycetaceae bacterium]|nr:ATP synthase F0 subunit B [Planctomycetaceae bacterium]